MGSDYCVVLTTTDSEAVKQKLISEILSNNLAACIQTFPIESHYLWQGSVCHDQEILISIKTLTKLYSQLSLVIEANHNYDLPQIIQLPIVDGLSPYLEWIRNTTQL